MPSPGFFVLTLLCIGSASAERQSTAIKFSVARPGAGGGPLRQHVACTCQDKVCGCCARIDVEQFNFNQTGCINLTYNPDDVSITLNVIINDKSIYETGISARNPPPICVPIPQLPAVSICVRLYDIQLQGQDVRACINLEVQVQMNPLAVFSFDCVRLGASGVGVEKPKLLLKPSEDYDYIE